MKVGMLHSGVASPKFFWDGSKYFDMKRATVVY